MSTPKLVSMISKYLEQLKFYKYLGLSENGDNSIEEEIKERIDLGNKAHYAHHKIFKSKLISKKAKLKLHWTIIRPVITYDGKTWVLKESMKWKLLVTERKILRRIFGPTKDRDVTWRIKTNDELNNLIINNNIINYIKAQRINWFGHVHRIQMTGWSKTIWLETDIYKIGRNTKN